MAALSQLYQKYNRLRGRRVFILPTRFGILYAAFLLLILLAAINYSNSLGHILCFLLASMGVLAMHYSYNNLAKLELINAYAEPTFCGQPIKFKLVIDNPTANDCYHISVASKQNDRRSWNPFKNLTGYNYQSHQTIEQLPPNNHHQHTISVTSQRRGKQRLGQVRIASQFPFGLFDSWTYFNTQFFAIIYPKPEGSLPLVTSAQDGAQKAGKQTKGLDDFSGFNNYRLGDAIHSVAWKAAARDEVLRTKQFSSALSGKLILSWQDTASLHDTELRLSQLCRWVLDAENSASHYALELPTTFIDYGLGQAHQQQCLTALALYE